MRSPEGGPRQLESKTSDRTTEQSHKTPEQPYHESDLKKWKDGDEHLWAELAADASDAEIKKIFAAASEKRSSMDGRSKEARHLNDLLAWFGANYSHLAPENTQAKERHKHKEAIRRRLERVADETMDDIADNVHYPDVLSTEPRGAAIANDIEEPLDVEFSAKDRFGEHGEYTTSSETSSSIDIKTPEKKVEFSNEYGKDLVELVKKSVKHPEVSSAELEKQYKDLFGKDAPTPSEEAIRAEKLTLVEGKFAQQEMWIEKILTRIENIANEFREIGKDDKEGLQQLVAANASLEHDLNAVLDLYLAHFSRERAVQVVETPKIKKMFERLKAQGIRTDIIENIQGVPRLAGKAAEQRKPVSAFKKRPRKNIVALEDLTPEGSLGQPEAAATEDAELIDDKDIIEAQDIEPSLEAKEALEDVVEAETGAVSAKEQEAAEEGWFEEEADTEEAELGDEEDFSNLVELPKTQMDTLERIAAHEAIDEASLQELEALHTALRTKIESDPNAFGSNTEYIDRLTDFSWNEVAKKPSFFGKIADRFFGGSKRERYLSGLVEAQQLISSEARIHRGKGRAAISRAKKTLSRSSRNPFNI